MPISRSNTVRNKSRSPAPPPLTPDPSATRAFLPPSHYATAGGFNSRSPVIRVGSSAIPGEAIEQKKTQWRQTNSKRKDVRNEDDIHLGGPSDSDSLENRTPTFTMARPSSRSGFPDLEAQLLPSLRDTIDRMTGASSRVSTQFSSGVKNTESTKRGNNYSPRQHAPDFRTTAVSTQSKLQLSSSYPVQDRNDELNVSNIYSNQVTPTIGNTPFRLKPPAKSALKSSFRSPTSTISSSTPSVPPVNPTTATGASLRTMKSLLSRKCSGTLRSPFNGTKSSNEGNSKGPSAPNSLGTAPRPEHRTVAELDHNGGSSTKKSFHSNIPRPYMSRYHQDGPIGSQNPEGSDLDRRYDSELRDRRKLTVANAEVPISLSSESDAESRKRFDLANAVTNARNLKSRENRSPVGLGLSLRKNLASERYTNPQLHQWESRSRSPENPRPLQQEKSLRFSLPASESAGSSYSDEFTNYRPESYRRHSGPDSISVDFTRRKSEFQFEAAQSTGSKHQKPPQLQRQRLSPNSAIYDATTDEDTESEREGYSFRRKRSNEKGQSPVHTKVYSAVSEKESDGFVPIISPRPRSACQRRESPSPRASDGVSPTLRELIKSRHSFSKPFSETKQSSPHNFPGKPRQRNMEYGEAYSETPIPQTPQRASPHLDLNRHHHQEQYRDEKERHGRTAASAIAEDYRSAAARERMAFGIPPSESDEVLNAHDFDDQHLSSAESNMSSINASLWQEDSEDLSEEAESIFRSLRHSTKRHGERDSSGQDTQYDRTPRLSVVSPTLSGSSTCDVRLPNGYVEPQAGDDAQGTSKTREGVIQEIFETEEDLIRHFHICMNMFVLPLRVHNSRSWIAGVPADIARLLDWFDDIVNLHEQIYDSLCSARDTMSPATDRVSESLRCFVLKVEVYQPYLVRLADVSEEIARLVDDPKSDFGQFISIQQRYPECGAWSFERLLMLPVNRLAAYQDLFARLLDLTPKTHQDYLSTFSLSRSTDMVIRIMTEVKIREDEYNLLKTFSSRIQGLPPSNGLATRERRLLHSGPLALIISGLSETSKQPWDPGYQLQASESRRADRSSRLLDAISTSSSVFGRSESEKSASSFDTGDSSGKGPVATSTPVKSSWFSRLPLRKRARSKSPLPVLSQPTESRDNVELPSLSYLQTVPVHAFVFSDLVLLAQPVQTYGDKPHWILSLDLGVFRPLSIARIQDMKQEGTVLSLEALALNADNFNDNIDFGTASFLTVDLLLPRNNVPPTGAIENSVVDELFEPWILSFRQCTKTTLRKLTFLGLGTQQHPSCASDRTLDAFLAVSSLVGSGLPLPRSPSGQFPNQFKDGTDELSGDEREERGWWSLRYQQVFREYQRQDSLLSDEDDAV